jgi:hypothetical protein
MSFNAGSTKGVTAEDDSWPVHFLNANTADQVFRPLTH